MFGIPPLNPYDLAASDLAEPFTSKPDFTPYAHVPVNFDVAPNAAYGELTANIDFSAPDAEEISLRAAIARSEGLPRAR